MRKIKKFNENIQDTSLTKLVEEIMDTLKIDVQLVRESDPELIEYVGEIILSWIDKNVSVKQ